MYKTNRMCDALDVPHSSFYAWRKRPVSDRDKQRVLVSQAVEIEYHRFKKRYGAPRLTPELNAQSIPCCINHFADLMKEQGLRAHNGKGFKYRPRAEARTNIGENFLNRDFEAKAPDQKWVSDITYIKVGRIWLYLAVVLDLYSRKVIGWSLDNHMREDLIIEAFTMAVSCRNPGPDTLLHSDRGVQFRSNRYQMLLYDHEIQCSMSRKGNCWDNAVMESFFSRLKVELIYPENYNSIEDVRVGIFEYIECFYNQVRRHSANDYISPNQYEHEFRQLAVSRIRG